MLKLRITIAVSCCISIAITGANSADALPNTNWDDERIHMQLLQSDMKLKSAWLTKDENRQGGTRVHSSDDFKKPRVLSMTGCSGSSWILDFAAKLLEAHGYNVQIGMHDGYNLQYAAEFLDPKWRLYEPDSPLSIRLKNVSMEEALRIAHDEATAQGKTLLFKLHNPTLPDGPEGGTDLRNHPRVVSALHELDAFLVHGIRRNRLDHFVCAVRDCFVGSPHGFPIDRTTGNKSGQCRSPGDSDNHAKLVDDQAWLNESILIDNLRSNIRTEDECSSIVTLGEKPLFPHVPIMYYEDLNHFEDDASYLEHGVQMWLSFLAAWGVEADREIVAAKLKPLAGSRPLKAHAKDIYNIEGVKATLEPFPELFEFLRL